MKMYDFQQTVSHPFLALLCLNIQAPEQVCISVQTTVITLRAKHSGAVYCNRSCLWRAEGRVGGRAVSVTMTTFDNPKLRASIFTKLGL